MDLHNPETQDELFREYFQDEDASMVDELVKLNRQINTLASTQIEDKMSKNRWRLLSIDFSNLFSYGEDNKIDFGKVSGVCGNFAKNATGKTSFLNTIPFTIFGTFPNMSTLESAMNDQADAFESTVMLECGTSKYKIVRTGKRTKRGISQKLEFVEYTADGEEITHTEDVKITQKKINDLFGSLDSYVKSSYMAQKGAPMFLDLTPAPRKEWFNKNLGLEFFEVLNKMAKSESDHLRSKINVFKSMDFVSKEIHLLSELNAMGDGLQLVQADLDVQRERKLKVEAELQILREKIKPVRPEDLRDPQGEIDSNESLLSRIRESLAPYESGQVLAVAIATAETKHLAQIEGTNTQIGELKAMDPLENNSTIAEYDTKIQTVKATGIQEKGQIAELKLQIEGISDPSHEISELESKNAELSTQIEDLKRKLSDDEGMLKFNLSRTDILSKDRRYTEEDLCQTCPLIAESIEAKAKVEPLRLQIAQMTSKYEALLDIQGANRITLQDLSAKRQERTDLQSTLNALESRQAELKSRYMELVGLRDSSVEQIVASHGARIQQLEDSIALARGQWENTKESITLRIQREMDSATNQLRDAERTQTELKNRLMEYRKALTTSEENAKISQEITLIQNSVIKELTDAIEELEGSVNEMTVNMRVVQSKIDENAQQLEEYKTLLEDYKVYELYLKATDKGGIPFFYVQKIMSRLEDGVNSILSTIVDFRVVLEASEDTVECSLTSPSKGNWRSDLLSGMETFMVNLAFRLGIAEIANISQPNFMVVDEGFGVLDADHVSETPKLFDLLRQRLDFILLVSHNPTMQDFVDHQLTIDRRGGKSYISL
jgi:DNA repair exonuclease SbcCD ATPase subunit